MGGEQSTNRNSGSPRGEPAKTCYYDVLGVERQATEDEYVPKSSRLSQRMLTNVLRIKKAYRRKALELHPDRNYGNVESATVAFAEVSTAYEVLSDPQERAWYDSHRDSILGGDTGKDDGFEHSVQVTSAGDLAGLMGRFNSSVSFTDASNGFYGILQQTFVTLAREEDAACDWEGLEPVDFPDFGSKDDVYEDVVRPFYRTWIDFQTKKTFSWRDQYRLSDAPDRMTRRAMEKENKRLREEGIREFNDAVRVLVAFVRKRDPRYIPNSQTEADRQKILRDAAAAQAARSRAENKKKFEQHVVPDWAKAQVQPAEEVGTFSDEEEEVVETVECVVCNKTFKSEKQYETHERSKKHIKAVQQLKWEMNLENEELNLDEDPVETDDIPVSSFAKLEISDVEAEVEKSAAKPTQQVEISSDTEDAKVSMSPPIAKASSKEDSSSDGDDTYASRKEVLSRLSQPPSIPTSQADLDSTPAASDIDTSSKVGKAKLKRAKKAAKQEQDQDDQFKCASCQEAFTSKTKLHAHIEREGHAIFVGGGKPAKTGKGKSKNKR